MQVIRHSGDGQLIGDPVVRELVVTRLEEWQADLFAEDELPGYFLIIEPTDSLDDLQGQLGFDPLENRHTGLRHGQPGYTPSFEMVEQHITFFEMVFVLGDDGAGVVVVVPDHESVPVELLALCRSHAIPHQEHHT